ncbi:sensor histidine kinase [Falsiroseomonas tokyonensis]|uniref:Sensor histidine kinase n=1 Tax=Falsiroseomonas tokyonensis TaxID=430521 RepID=A0ABV7BYG6_9PROT|nr:PAS domain-containing protein [Falsiroseomonas tokyonensis]MBU8539680.1 PAS domain-containing protein [Falsiroseomonas tokyonensis]
MGVEILTLPVRTSLAPGLCTLVDPDLIYLHLISDVAIGLAYFSIPAALLIFARRRRDLAYPWVVLLFAAFIIACGTTHLMHAWTMFRPDYETEGLVKVVTAAISVTTAILLWPLLPRLLALPSPQALAREVEERRIAEARALASEARTAAFIEHLPEALFVLRPGPRGDFTAEAVNPAFERLYGIEDASIRGHDMAEVLPPALLARLLPHWRQAMETRRPVDYTTEAETGIGWRVWQTILVPMVGPDGQVERLLGSARDITMTRRLQADLLQSARLATIGTMCAGLAHETSQPLNAAMLWTRNARAVADGMEPAESADRLRQSLGIIEGQLRRAGDLVGRIRALPGEDEGTPQPFDAAATAASALRLAMGQYAGEGIDFALHSQASTLPVQGVPARLEQALLQLLANARDAVLDRREREPDAPMQIVLTLREEPGEAVLEVEDSGPGVPEGLRDAIFDPFFTTREPGRGSGLGLPLAAAVARGMGGGIEARNRPEGGALFSMRLALAPMASLPAGGAVTNQ